MKKILFLLILMGISIKDFAQPTNLSISPTREEYYQKSREQRTAAFILLGTGGALFIAGVKTGMENMFNNMFDNISLWGSQPTTTQSRSSGSGAEALLAVGSLAFFSSIPFFISAAKNKKRGMNTTTSLKVENLDFALSDRSKSFPAVSFKVSLK